MWCSAVVTRIGRLRFARSAVLVDGAHDRHAARRLSRDLGDYFSGERTVCRGCDDDVVDVVGTRKFKDGCRNIAMLKEMVRDLAPRQLQRLCPASQFSRLLDMDVLSGCIDIVVDSGRDVDISRPARRVLRLPSTRWRRGRR